MIKDIEHCPICKWICNQKTNYCSLSNPVFDCKYKHIEHLHRWCRNGHEWITDVTDQNILSQK